MKRMEPSQRTIEMVFGFPRRGEVYGTFEIASATIDPDNQTWTVVFNEEVNKKLAIEALSPFYGKQAIFAVDGQDFSVEFPRKHSIESIRSNPPGAVQTRVTGEYVVNGAFQNPISEADFNADMDKMTVSNPKKHFRVYPAGELHSKQFRDKLFSFVTRRGESYGWVSKGEIFHRKGSLVMPYVKINKHIEGSTVSYHTHPSKDEPSLTSPDDIQWYMDAMYKWNIRHFYTIMKDRLDHFEFKSKGDKGKARYLKMDESKFVDDLNTLLDKVEKVIKENEELDDYDYCVKVTRAWVKDINDKYKHLVEILYHPHERPGAVRKNPPARNNPGSDTPFPHTTKIKVDDKYISIALNELKGIDYDWIHYGGDEFSHTMYVYWWLKYHFLPKADGTDRLWMWEKKGLDGESRSTLRNHLQQEVEDGWTYGDCMLLLGLYHDIAKKREKEQRIHHSILGAQMFKEEIASELKLPANLTDRLALILDTDVGRKRTTEDEFKTVAGDLYPICKLFHMADRTAHHPYMYTIAARMARKDKVLSTGEYGDAFIEVSNEHDIKEVVKFFRTTPLQNPPPRTPTKVTYKASYEVAIDPDTAEFLFAEYDPRQVPGTDGKLGGTFMMTYRQGLYIRMTLGDGAIASATLGFRYPGVLNITGVPTRDDFGLSAAQEVYERVGQVLQQAYDVEIDFGEEKPVTAETFDTVPASDEESALQPLTNPRTAGTTIILAGAHGSGRRELAKELHKQGGFVLCPMHTTERKPGRVANQDCVNHTHDSFMEEVNSGNMKYWVRGKNGECYGYTKAQLEAPKSVMYTTPRMAMKMKDEIPNVTIVFVDNKDSVRKHKDRLIRRKGVTNEMATATAKRKHTLRNSRHNFDHVIDHKDNYKKAAITLINPPVLNNPQFDIEGVDFYATIPQVKYKNLGAVSAEIEVDRNIPKELVGNVKDIFYGLIQDYEKKTDKRVALAIAFAIDEITQEVKNRGGNGVIGFTVETGGSLGLPVVEFNKTIPAVVIVTGDAIKTRTTLKNPSSTFNDVIEDIFKISEQKQYTLFNRLVKLMEESGEIAEEVLIKEGYKPYKQPGKDGVEGEISDAIIVLLMAFERNGGTPEQLRGLMEKSIGKSIQRNPRTPGGKKFPDKYLKGLTPLEKMIAEDEIDKGYEYDVDDPKAYKFWKSDIKAKARGMKIGPSKHRLKYYKMYRNNIDPDYKPSGKTQKAKFLNRIVKETGIKKKYLEEIYNKGLAAWRVGHRPGVQQHQWAAGRVYAFAVAAESSTGKGKPDHKLAVEAGVRKNPPASDINEDFERMKQMAYEVRTKEIAGEPINGRDWWNQQIPQIEEAYGTEPLNARWLIPLDTTGFDPSDKSQEFDDDGVKPLHFLNQLKRIPMTKPPTPERIMQVALNIGQGQVHGIIPEDYGLEDFIVFDNPPIEVMPRTNELNTTRFINLETDEDVTGKLFDGAILNTKEYPNLHVGKELNLSSKLPNGIPKKLNIAKMGNERVIVFDGGRLLAKKVNIDGPVYLETSPFSRNEPSGFVVATGRAHYDESAYTVSDVRITRWDDSVIPMLRPPYFIYDEVTIQSSPAVYGPLPNPSPSKQPKASFDWLEKFTAWVELVNMKNKELIEFLESDPWGKEAGINKEKAKEEGISRGRFSASRILIMRKKLGLTGPKDYIKAGPMIIRNYYELAQKKWSEADWNWCRKQVSFNSRARGQSGPYTDSKGRPTRKLTALWVWGHDPWRYARKIEKRNTMPKCPDVPWIGRTEKRMYGTTQYKYPEVKSNPFIGPSDIHGTGTFADQDYTQGEVVFETQEEFQYVNHSDVPNISPEYMTDGQVQGIANTNITEGEELLLDYDELRELIGLPESDGLPEEMFNPPFRRPRLYHGSSINNLKILKPHMNKTIGREVVFATPNYEYALAMSVPSSNKDLDIGYVNGQFMIEEQYEGAFDLLKQAAYIYEVDAQGFYEHPQFPEMERIIEVSVPVKKAKRIPNVYQELRRVGADLIPYW